MDNQAKGKVYIIYAKTAEAKRKWMEAFQKEKERVREDRERGEGAGGRRVDVCVSGGGGRENGRRVFAILIV